jgi:hypothetical protein
MHLLKSSLTNCMNLSWVEFAFRNPSVESLCSLSRRLSLSRSETIVWDLGSRNKQRKDSYKEIGKNAI